KHWNTVFRESDISLYSRNTQFCCFLKGSHGVFCRGNRSASVCYDLHFRNLRLFHSTITIFLPKLNWREAHVCGLKNFLCTCRRHLMLFQAVSPVSRACNLALKRGMTVTIHKFR